MEQLAARRAHNPKVVWFESHSRYHRIVNRLSFFCFVGSSYAAAFKVWGAISSELDSTPYLKQRKALPTKQMIAGVALWMVVARIFIFIARLRLR